MAASLTSAIGRKGELIQTRPRGFYLKIGFTQALLRQAFGFLAQDDFLTKLLRYS